MVVPVAPVDTFLVNILFSGITMKFFSFPYGYAYGLFKVESFETKAQYF
jgi:hypothetical protein